jgi:hypothetical protein
VLRTTFSRYSLSFFLSSDFAKPIPLREKHAQCVKKSGFFTRFLRARNVRILFFEEIPHFQPGFAKGVADSIPWHEFGCDKRLMERLFGVKISGAGPLAR